MNSASPIVVPKLRPSTLFDPLESYLFTYSHAIDLWYPPYSEHTITSYGTVTTMILHRHPPFQMELIIMHPGAPPWRGEHRHPNVDSIEVALYECINFTKNKEVAKADYYWRGRPCVRLRPADWHGTPYMPLGASLLSFQHWLNNKPMASVGLDWEGEPVSDVQANLHKTYTQITSLPTDPKPPLTHDNP